MSISLRLSFALLISLLLCNTGYGKEIAWQFDEAEDIKAWTTSNAYIEQSSRGIISVRGSDPFRIVSPSNLDVPSNLSTLQFRIKVPASNLFGYVLIKTVDNKTWFKRYPFGIANDFNVYQFNLRQVVQTDAAIDSLIFAFGGIDKVELDYVKFTAPSFFDSLKYNWRQFWKIAPLTGTTINYSYTPSFMGRSFLLSLYIILLLLTILMVIIFRLTGKKSIISPLLVSFAVTGMLFAVRMDYQWYMQWPDLQPIYPQYSAYERKLIFVNMFEPYSLARKVKQLVPSDKKIRIYSGDSETKSLLSYYLLPLIYSDNGDYIVVYADSKISFDSARNKLMIGKRVVAENVSLISAFEGGTTLYKANRFNQ